MPPADSQISDQVSAPTARRKAVRPDVRVAVVIVNYRTPHLIRECLAALKAEREFLSGMRALVVDGGSDDGSAEDIRRTVAETAYKDWVSFLPLAINGGFGWANNQAILTLARESRPPEFIHLLNPDAQVTEGAIAALIEDLERHPRGAAAGSQLLDANHLPSGSAFRFPTPGREFLSAARSEKLGRLFGIKPMVVETKSSVEVDWVTGASVMFRVEALRSTGLFDDGFFLYFEEVELLHRMRRAGWSVRHVPESRVIHIEGASTGLGESAESRPFPDYWYRSRRRYFGLTGGQTTLIVANLAWFIGRLLSLPISIIRRRGKPRTRASRILRSFAGHRADLTPSFQMWGDRPGKPPAWMEQQ